MNKTNVALFLTFFWLTSTLADLKKEYPVTHLASLSTGQDISLPFHARFEGISLFTLASLKSLNKVLKPEGLKAKKILPGFGLVAILVLDYKTSTVGPYKEYMTSIQVESENQEDSFFIYNISVTSELSKIAGIEIWGYPKTMISSIDSFQQGPVDIEVRAGEEEFFKLICKSCNNKKSKLSEISYYVITPKRIKRTNHKAIIRGQALEKMFVPFRDKLIIHPDYGRKIKPLGRLFPIRWLRTRNGQAVIFENEA